MGILSKKEVRNLVLNKRLSLSQEIISLQSDSIIKLIRQDKNYQTSQKIGIYLPIKGEVDVRRLLTDDKIFCVPKVVGSEMIFTKIDLNTKYHTGKYNILEPINTELIIEIDYLIVPSVAIYNNYRLGFGGGYYDKYLSQSRPKHVVGVIYDFQEVPFELDAHDQPLDYYFKG
ncbi:MAG: 5-formyltetrahydrofolate cyclo-ligase [Acholeplasmataceae bacterium]|jgi:5-formyltetrahydrofolate cyclo-ligase